MAKYPLLNTEGAIATDIQRKVLQALNKFILAEIRGANVVKSHWANSREHKRTSMEESR